MLDIGDEAPDFSLKAQDGEPWRLSDAVTKHKCIVLAFYLLDFSGV